jgi:hypothetical protein
MKAETEVNVSHKLQQILMAIQRDPGNRGLARDPHDNLLTACPDDFALACASLAGHSAPTLAVLTGFYILTAGLGETDGPLGAVYLARTLPLLGIRVVLVSDPFCRAALCAGLAHCKALSSTPVLDLPAESGLPPPAWWQGSEPTHLLALERVGPAHTPESIRAQPGAGDEDVAAFLAEVPAADHDRCHNMRGLDISAHMRDATTLFESRGGCGAVTLGIGDGGNEMGMGKVRWQTIRRNIPRGATIACRVPADHLIVAGVSNWGAYALAAGVALLRGVAPPDDWFDLENERAILSFMVEQGPLVDGVSGKRLPQVDGQPFEDYARVLHHIRDIVRG